LKNYGDAITELKSFLTRPFSADADSIRSGAICLMEAAHEASELDSLNLALTKLSEIDPLDSQIAKGRFLQALLLKNSGHLEKAYQKIEDLLATFPDFPDRPSAIFELVDLEYRSRAWEKCRERSLSFLNQFPSNTLSISAWRYLAAASSHLAAEHPESKDLLNQRLADLQALLESESAFSPSEINDWKFYLAESYFNLNKYEDAWKRLEPLIAEDIPFSQAANAHLLLGLCYRDGKEDLPLFCKLAEAAISKNQNLISKGNLHISLFNAYLELSKNQPEFIEKSAEHLYGAFLEKADITKENLLWLGEWYFAQCEERENPLFVQRAFLILEELVATSSDPIFLEGPSYKLGKLHALTGDTKGQIVALEKLNALYQEHLSTQWKWEKETYLALALGYKANGEEEKALSFFDAIIRENPPIQSETLAKAYFEKNCLRAERLQKWSLEDIEFIAIAAQFKDLSLLRRLDYEPIHLEAALEYVHLLEKTATDPIEKRLFLLEKTKKDFESKGDLLSQDYHQARMQLPLKNLIFEGYMRFIDAEILMAKAAISQESDEQKELQAKAKDLLLQIKSEKAHPKLLARVFLQLQSTDASADIQADLTCE
jgi:hypothetical protein